MSAQASEWVRAEDCTTGLQALGDRSVSLVVTDPPYFTDGTDSDWDSAKLRRRITSGLIKGIPSVQRFDSRQGAALQEFMAPIATELMRVLKPGGFLLCFSLPRLAHRMGSVIENAGFDIRDLLAWHHGEGQPKAFAQTHFVRDMDMPEHEREDVLERLGGRKTAQLKPEMEMIVMAQSPRCGTLIENWLEHETGLIDTSAPILNPTQFPATVMPCPKPKVRYNHLTVKPVKLMRHLIRIFSAPGATVLDPFAGTGTTGVASLMEGRQFVGFERETEMAEVANQRISGTEDQRTFQLGLQVSPDNSSTTGTRQ